MPITAIQKACQSVSRHCLVVFDRTGKPAGERDVDQSIGFGVTRNTYSAHSKFSENTQADRNFDRIDGEPMDFEWNIFPGFNTLQLNDELKCLLLRLDETPENFTGRIIFMTMFNDVSCGSRDNEQECLSNANLVSLHAKRFGKGQWTFIGLGSEKKWCSISEDSPQGEWDHMAERMLVESAESGFSIHYAADLETIETIFSITVSANQLSLYGAVAEMCEEYESLHDGTGQPIVRGNSPSSLVLNVIKTETPLDCDDLANQNILLQHFGERIEKLS